MKKIWFEKEIFGHLLTTLVYFLSISFFWFFGGRLGNLGRMAGLWLGAFLGTFLLDIDHLLYWFITHPEQQDSREAHEIVVERSKGKRGIRRIVKITTELYLLLEKVHFSHTRLVFHSVVGQTVLFVLAVFVLTSGGSVFGSALVVATNLHLLKDEWTDFAKNKEHLADWLFWQIREPRAKEFVREYILLASLLFLALTGLLVKS